MTTDLPLVVDLDETLLRTDTLSECFAQGLFASPLAVLAALPAILRGRPAFKAKMTATVAMDLDCLIGREDLIAYLREQKAAGREIHLATGAAQEMADQIAARFDLFDSATGSGGGVNLKGPNKQAFLRRRFPGGYVYAGDSRADLKVWRDADGIILAGASPGVARAARALGKPVEAEFPSSHGGLADWLAALRTPALAAALPVFAPLIAAPVSGATLASAALAFVALCMAASGASVLSEVAAMPADRNDAARRDRPFAACRIPPLRGVAAGAALCAAALVISTIPGSGTLLAAAIWLALALAYSMKLKRVPVAGSVTLAGLAALAVLTGVTATGGWSL